MRIIAGKARGHQLLAPKGSHTRPTPDRVREALFSILADAVHDAQVLDLYAGTGALGLEALSRGAAHAIFVENNRNTAALITRNATRISTSGIAATAAQVICLDVQRALVQLGQRDTAFDLIFLDPPYPANAWHDCLAALSRNNLLTPHALVVCEHPSRVAVPASPDGCHVWMTRTFGDVAITIYRHGEPSFAGTNHGALNG